MSMNTTVNGWQVERVEIPGDADGSPLLIERREHPVHGREVTVEGRPLFADPAKLRMAAGVLEFNAVWLEARGGSDE
jgi:hypothetical protein